MKTTIILCLLLIGVSAMAQGPKVDPKPVAGDTLASISELSIKRYEEAGKQINNFRNPEWIKQQVGILTMLQTDILQTALETQGRNPAEWKIQSYDEKMKKLIIKPIPDKAIIIAGPLPDSVTSATITGKAKGIEKKPK